MAARGARTAWAASLAALSLAAAAPPAGAADPAADALSARDAYASPRALGPLAPAAEAQLQEAADRLAERGQPVKLAIVAGPAGAPSMRVYARRLADEVAGEEETLVVTAPGRAVIAVGPRPRPRSPAACAPRGSARSPSPSSAWSAPPRRPSPRRRTTRARARARC